MKAAAALAILAFSVPGVVGADATQVGIGYICGAEHDTTPQAGATAAVMLQGVGNGASPADTANAQAQAWYDEGLNLYHAFNHNEAIAAFAKSASLDPTCALCEWGVALSLGPTLNYGVTPGQTALARIHAEAARKLVKPGDARAQALTEAMLVRYDKDRADRDVQYGKAMDDVARRYPADDEIADLTAQALMIPGRGDNLASDARAIELIRTVLARRPDDTAAIHYYIHATEFVQRPADALPYAERLASLAPGASHLVHMAAHTLMHVGQYEQVAIVDAQALKVDADTEKRLAYAGPLSAQMYYLHNYTFGLAGALMSGDGKLALKYADHADVAFPAGDKTPTALPAGLTRTGDPAERRVAATSKALIAYGRYEPSKALTLKDEPGDRLIVKVYRHYARGEAFASRGDAAAVRAEAEVIATLVADAGKAGEAGTVNVGGIAGGVLAGRAALLDRQPDKAAALFAKAAADQERIYPASRNFDPPPWWYPVRRSLAAADLAAGKPDEAIREARASLKDWPDDPLALKVVSQAEAKQGHADAAARDLAQARKIWRGDLTKMSLDLV